MDAQEPMMMSAASFTHSLVDRFFGAKTSVEKDEALGQLLGCIGYASAELIELFEYGYSKQEFERVVRKRLGLGSLRLIREAVAAIAKPIDADDSARMRRSPIKSIDGGDQVLEDDIYYRVMLPALTLFFGFFADFNG